MLSFLFLLDPVMVLSSICVILSPVSSSWQSMNEIKTKFISDNTKCSCNDPKSTLFQHCHVKFVTQKNCYILVVAVAWQVLPFKNSHRSNCAKFRAVSYDECNHNR